MYIVSIYLSIYLCFVITGVMNVTGGIIHDQSEVDTDTSIQERIALGIGQFNAVIQNCRSGSNFHTGSNNSKFSVRLY